MKTNLYTHFQTWNTDSVGIFDYQKAFVVQTNLNTDLDDNYYCKPIVEGLDVFTVELEIQCYAFNNVHVCPYSKGKENSFRQYISKMNSIDSNEVYGDEHKYHLIGYGDNDLSQAYLKYLYYDDLYAMGILDDNGNVNDNKEDEWEFFWRFNHSKYINNSVIIMIYILLLFLLI